ncbi:MAG TPA: hypothetical protein VNO22_06910 [Planctomycetota bacterium]|nr:hypothetical protein [Planctomycetota bacterium]
MMSFVLALALSAPLRADAPLPTALSQEPGQDSAESGREWTMMEYVTAHSLFDLGVLYTAWDADLDLENDLGFYVRYGLGIGRGFSLSVTYRHYDYDNSDVPGPGEEHVLIRGLFGGLGLRLDLTQELSFAAAVSVGAIRWESHGLDLSDDTGPAFSAEGALSFQLHEALRIRAGASLDGASTEFRGGRRESVLGLSGMFGLELLW